MSKQEHGHNYVAEKYTVQKEYQNYMSDGKYHTGILSLQRIILFCTHCGDSKKTVADDE